MTTEEQKEIREEPQGNTQFDRLRKLREQIGSERTHQMDIPGYSGSLVVTYQLLEWGEVRKIMRRMEKAKAQGDIRELMAQADTLIRACVEIKYRDKDQLIDLMPGTQVRYDKNLATVLGFEAQNGRQVVIETFKNDIAISAHYGELMEWMQGNSQEADEEFLGE